MVRMIVYAPCGLGWETLISGDEGAGFVEWNVPNAFAGTYSFNLQVRVAELLANTLDYFDIYYDNTLIRTDGPFTSYAWDPFAIFDGHESAYTTPFYSSFLFDAILDTIASSEYNFFTNSTYNDTLCIPGGWIPEIDPLTVAIISGFEYGTLMFDDQPVGSTITLLQNDFNRVEFHANDTLPNGEDQTVIVQTSAAGITKTDAFTIHEIEPYCMEVTLDPLTLGPGDTASVILKKHTIRDVLKDFPPDQGFYAQIIEGLDYGTLLSSNGVDTADALLTQQGFKFIASEDINVDSAHISIRVDTLAPSVTKTIDEKPIEGMLNTKTDYLQPNVKNKKVIPTRKLSTDGACSQPIAEGVVKNECTFSECTSATPQTNISETVMNPLPLGHCSGTDGGAMYPTFSDANFSVCENKQSSSCKYKLNVNTINVDLTIGLCPNEFTSLPTDVDYLKNHTDVCEIKSDFQATYDWLTAANEQNLWVFAVPPGTKYILIDAVWDHEKQHRDNFKNNILPNILLPEFKKRINERCIDESKACLIQTGSDGGLELSTQGGFIWVDINGSWGDCLKRNRNDFEVAAQKEQVRKYKRMLLGLAKINCD